MALGRQGPGSPVPQEKVNQGRGRRGANKRGTKKQTVLDTFVGMTTRGRAVTN